MLNPWKFEYEYRDETNMYLTIVNQDTGEIRGASLSVDDLSGVIEVNTHMINRLAKIQDELGAEPMVKFIREAEEQIKNGVKK